MTPNDAAGKSETSKPRTLSGVVQKSPGCIPLKHAYAEAVKLNPKAWPAVQALFVKGMEGFDRNVAEGKTDLGDLQNGKGDFFNDLLALILENCAQVQLYSRGGVPGLIFPKHNLDVAYPAAGITEFVLEAKAVGTPKHKASPKARVLGRPGSADLDKRVKEIAFKTIDLKAEYARILAATGESPSVISGDLSGWLRAVKPKSYVFFAARVINEKDLSRVIHFANVAALVSDAVGIFCFGPRSEELSMEYVPRDVPSHLQLERVLFRACQELTGIRQRRGG